MWTGYLFAGLGGLGLGWLVARARSSRDPSLPRTGSTNPSASADLHAHNAPAVSNPPLVQHSPHAPPEAWLERHQQLQTQWALTHRRSQISQERHMLKSRGLHLHLSPHFMFNALTSVQWLWSRNQGQRAVASFKSFMELWNALWMNADQTTHTIEAEIEALGKYLDLENQRIARHVHVHWDIDPALDTSLHIPVLVCQPLLENAIWHGFSKNSEDDVVPLLSIQWQALPPRDGIPWIAITILDNGSGLPPELDDVIKDSSEPSAHAQPAHAGNHRSHGMALLQEALATTHESAHLELTRATPPWSTRACIMLPGVRPKA
jgi:LytS/YehU family sensor histidine kinase